MRRRNNIDTVDTVDADAAKDGGIRQGKALEGMPNQRNSERERERKRKCIHLLLFKEKSECT